MPGPPSGKNFQTTALAFLGVFAFAYPLVTGHHYWTSTKNACWALMAASTFASGMLLFCVRFEPLRWNALIRLAAVLGILMSLYSTVLLGATFGFQRPEIFFFLPLSLGAGVVLVRPEFLKWSSSREVQFFLTALVLVGVTVSMLSRYQYVSLAGSDFRRTGILAMLGCVVLFLLVVTCVQSDVSRRGILISAVSAGALVAAISLWQFFDPGEPARRWFLDLYRDPRPMGTMGHPNWLGTYLCLILPLAAVMFLEARSGAARLAAAFACALLFASLLICQTRGAWIAAVCFLAWLAFRQRHAWRKILPLFASFALVTVILLPCKNWEIYRRMTTFGREVSLASDGSGGTGSGRFAYWIYGLQHLPPHLLLGAGLDTFAEVGARDKTPPRIDKAHSLYLEYALTLGLPGLALYLFFLWSCVKPFPGKPENMIRWGLRASIGTYLIQGIFIHDTIHTWPMVWIIAGLAAARVAPLQTESEKASCIGQRAGNW